LLPQAAAQRFEAAMNMHVGKTASFKLLRLQSTQTVDAVAAAHGGSAAQLRTLNNIPAGMKPVSGSVLLVPAVLPAGVRADGPMVASATMQTTPDVVRVRVPARPRESAVDLSRRCGVSSQDVMAWNAIRSKAMRAKLAKGAQLTVWLARESPGPCAAIHAAGGVKTLQPLRTALLVHASSTRARPDSR
jgi:LysM domain